MRTRLLLIFILLICAEFVFGQYSDFKYKKENHSSQKWYNKTTKASRYFYGGVGIGINNYFGDLTPRESLIKNAIKVTRPGANIFAAYHISNLFGVKADIIYQRIVGDDFNTDPYSANGSVRKYTRNLSFRNDLIGLSFQGYMNILGDPFEYYKRRDFNFYLLAGITMFYSNPMAKLHENPENPDGRRWVSLRPLGTEGQNHPEIGGKYSSMQFAIPFGLGFKYRLSHRFDLIAEGTLSYVLSDYIDDVGSSYVDLGVFEDDGLARAMSDRSREEKAVMKDEIRDREVISDYTNYIEYTSVYDGETYRVLEGFGNDGEMRGGGKNDIIASLTFKISYIFTK